MPKRISPKKEAEVLRLLREGHKREDAARLASVSVNTAGRVGIRNGLFIKQPDNTNPETFKINPEKAARARELYETGMSLDEVGVVIGCLGRAAAPAIRRAGGTVRWHGDGRTEYTANHAAFDVLTDEAAYWIGFLMADGCVYVREGRPNCRPIISLDLQARDIDQLHKFKAFVGSDAPIHRWQARYGEQVKTCVKSASIAARLAEYGVIPRKTGREVLAEAVKDNPHFWAGMVDGDGTVHWGRPTQHRPGYPTISLISAGRPVIEAFVAFLRRVAPGWNGGLTIRNKFGKNRPIYRAGITGSGAVRLAKTLYPPGRIALDRKMKTAHSFVSYSPSHLVHKHFEPDDLIRAYVQAGTWRGAGILLKTSSETIQKFRMMYRINLDGTRG